MAVWFLQLALTIFISGSVTMFSIGAYDILTMTDEEWKKLRYKN